MEPVKLGSLFSGSGGFELGGMLAGISSRYGTRKSSRSLSG
jgi:site-specific DNA-cytosine methylase